jgi:hypothetical protein
VKLHKWNDDVRGSTPTPMVGALAVLRCGRRASAAAPLPWSLCRCENTSRGISLVNVSDHRTLRDAVSELGRVAK